MDVCGRQQVGKVVQQLDEQVAVQGRLAACETDLLGVRRRRPAITVNEASTLFAGGIVAARQDPEVVLKRPNQLLRRRSASQVDHDRAQIGKTRWAIASL